MALDLILKGDLGARKKADGYPWFFRSWSPTFAGLVATPCRL
jgi:hypothetical protein